MCHWTVSDFYPLCPIKNGYMQLCPYDMGPYDYQGIACMISLTCLIKIFVIVCTTSIQKQ